MQARLGNECNMGLTTINSTAFKPIPLARIAGRAKPVDKIRHLETTVAMPTFTADASSFCFLLRVLYSFIPMG